MSDYERITREEARKKGLSTYYTGQFCKHGHIAPRRVSNYICIECSSQQWRKQHAAREPNNSETKARTTYLTERCPCDGCEFFAHCQSEYESCSAFACYVIGERWTDEPREPSKRMHKLLFGEAA